ncbi:MAG: glycosyltransferase [Steroidobacteraceae bacterium]
MAAMLPGMRYSIIVPAYNEEQWLPDTLQAIADARRDLPGEGEVIVVDNNSTDGTAAVAAAAGARVVFEPRNQIARARNAGAAAATGRILVFVDADTQITRGLLTEALVRLEQGRACAVGASICFDRNVGRVLGLFLRFFNWAGRRHGLLAGSFIAVGREAFLTVGGFPEQVYAGEELFLALKLRRWGRRHGRLPLQVVDAHPVITSARKMDRHSTWGVLRAHLVFALCPWLLRSRRFCRFWYER